MSLRDAHRKILDKFLIEKSYDSALKYINNIAKTQDCEYVIDLIVSVHPDLDKLEKIISYLIDTLPLEWFIIELSTQLPLNWDHFKLWTMIFVCSFRKNDDIVHPLRIHIGKLLEFGYEYIWDKTIEDIPRCEIFFDTILSTINDRLIILSIEYFFKYNQGYKNWYEYMMNKFVDFATFTCLSQIEELCKSITFRKWFRNIERMFDFKPRLPIKYFCDIEETKQQSYQVILGIILEDKVPSDVIKYIILRYL